MDSNDLEDQFHKIIQQCCQTKEDEENAKRYWDDFLVTDLINDALEE